MNKLTVASRYLLPALLITFLFGSISGQTVRNEQLLNGLKIAIVRNQTSPDFKASLRVHSGAAFDPLDKEGAMKVLSGMLFRGEGPFEFFAEDLGGNLEVFGSYDYIQINASSRPGEYIRVLEMLAEAVMQPEIDAETTAIAKVRSVGEAAQAESDIATIADRMIGLQLFGTFPYGRSLNGTSDSLEKIDFADVRFLFDRFFGADNATLVIEGPFDEGEAFRAVRRFFGGWNKLNQIPPSTFRRADDPKTALNVMNTSAGDGHAEIRHAVRGFARSDKDYYASEILAVILDKRLQTKTPNSGSFVRNEAFYLPGQMVFGVSRIEPVAKNRLYKTVQDNVDPASFINELLAGPLTASEFSSARNEILSAYDKMSFADKLLDAETYGLDDPQAERKKIEALNLASVQAVAESVKKRPMVSLWLVKGIDGAK